MAEIAKHKQLLILDDDQFFCDAVSDGIAGPALSAICAPKTDLM